MTPSSSVSQQETKNNDTKIEVAVKTKEEGEDSGMEKEDSVSNIDLSDLKKVRLLICFAWRLKFESNLESRTESALRG